MKGFDPDRLGVALKLVESAVAGGEIPGAVVLVGRREGDPSGPLAFGSAALKPQPRPMTPDTIFDLASLTKVVATTLVCWACLERGLLRLDDEVRSLLPGFRAAGVRVRHLLTHTSGLPAGLDLRAAGRDPAERLAVVLSEPPTAPPGRSVLYSDLGYIALAALLNAVAGRSLPDLARDMVFGPLGMTETRWLPPPEWRPRIAATEWADDLQAHAWGIVHDENTRALGGIAGHAGLFAPAADLGRLGRALLNGGGPVLRPRTVEAMTANVTPHLNEDRTLGWQARGRGGNAAGDLMTPAAYGHTGFTGTSLWIDPLLGLYAILLTNRVHLGRERSARAIIRLRPRFHNAVVAALA